MTFLSVHWYISGEMRLGYQYISMSGQMRLAYQYISRSGEMRLAYQYDEIDKSEHWYVRWEEIGISVHVYIVVSDEMWLTDQFIGMSGPTNQYIKLSGQMRMRWEKVFGRAVTTIYNNALLKKVPPLRLPSLRGWWLEFAVDLTVLVYCDKDHYLEGWRSSWYMYPVICLTA